MSKIVLITFFVLAVFYDLKNFGNRQGLLNVLSFKIPLNLYYKSKHLFVGFRLLRHYEPYCV